ncbi:unnamed protein product [Prorocentrum cordatum]|uniref:Uncharacterized protein n=1 Tax=Prorocentrum cordatum TaxID=2364126 RepID=A0ABN9T8W7_9DINO|nr:unnamed protein product [Polarella glacialis]
MRFRSVSPVNDFPPSRMSPRTVCLPSLVRTRPARTFSSDVLPDPEGPISAQTSPPFSWPLMLLRISFSPLRVTTVYPTLCHVKSAPNFFEGEPPALTAGGSSAMAERRVPAAGAERARARAQARARTLS